MNTKVVLGGILAILVLLFGATWLSNLSPRSEGVLSRNGLHWHPELEIYIKGEKQEIPECPHWLPATGYSSNFVKKSDLFSKIVRAFYQP